MNSKFKPCSGYKEKIRDSFNRQGAMKSLNVSIIDIRPGEVELEFPYDSGLTQQNGFIHAGIVSTVVDTACGYAAYTLMPEDASVLSIEFKINFLSPAKGERFRATGKVKKPGRNITVSEGELYSIIDGKEKIVASMVATIMAVRN